MLLAVNAAVNARDSAGRTALFEAASAGHDDVLRALTARGASLGLDAQGQASALAGAVTRGDVALLRRLLAAGADGNAADYGGRTPLHVAAAEGNLSAARALVELGRASAAASSGRMGNDIGTVWTPLDEARAAGAAGVVEYLEGLVRSMAEYEWDGMQQAYGCMCTVGSCEGT
jgi:ankyrin repeat protein